VDSADVMILEFYNLNEMAFVDRHFRVQNFRETLDSAKKLPYIHCGVVE